MERGASCLRAVAVDGFAYRATDVVRREGGWMATLPNHRMYSVSGPNRAALTSRMLGYSILHTDPQARPLAGWV